MSFVSGIVGASASTSAASTQAAATTQASSDANATQLAMYAMSREDTAPWRKTGEDALNALAAKINAGPGDHTRSPGYDFRLSEGEKAIQRSAAARGNLLGGGTLKALTRYGQDYATSDYDNFLRRYYESLTPLQSLAGVGQSTAAQTAASGNQVGGQIAANTLQAGINAGQAQAAGEINQANSIIGANRSGASNALLAYQVFKQPAMNYGAANASQWAGVDTAGMTAAELAAGV